MRKGVKTLDKRYNDLIMDINNHTDYNIPLIDSTIKEKYTLCNIIPFNYDFYNIDFLHLCTFKMPIIIYYNILKKI